jgi:phage/plasmid-like protein (TIGR03299 family)
MAHEVETMMWVDHGEITDRPWHGLGIRVEGCLSSEEAIIKAGLDWEVEKQPIFLSDGKPVEDNYAIVRVTDKRPLGVVGLRYVPFQNWTAFKFFDEVVGSGEAIYETAGSLRGGRIVWIMSRLPGAIGWSEDPIEKWLILSNAHDGSRKVMVTCSCVRVVCLNTLNAALHQAEVNFEMRHTREIFENIPDVREALGAVTTYFDRMQKVLELLRDRKMSEQEIKTYVHHLFPQKIKMGKEDELVEVLQVEIGPKIQAHIDKIFELIETGKGTDIAGVKGTAYGVYNAAVEWADFHKPIKKAGSELEARVHSMWFGTAARFKQRAFEQAVSLLS